MKKRETELELELWKSRMQTLQANADALNARGEVIRLQADNCQTNIARIEAALKAEEALAQPALQAVQ